jgi:hypothetical protein
MSHVASYRKSTWKMWLLMSLFALLTLTAYKPVAAMNSQADVPVVLIADILLPVYTTSSQDAPEAAFSHVVPPGDSMRSCLYMAWALGLRPSKSHDASKAAFTHAVPPGDSMRSCLYMAWALGLRPSN